MYSKEEYERSKKIFQDTMGLPDEGIAPISKRSKRKYDKYIASLPWKEQLFRGALFPVDPRVVVLPYGCKYGDDNRLLQDLAYPDRLKPDWDWAVKLVRENAPKHLYKYRTVNRYSLENLKNDTLWMSKAEDFNDPFDSVNLLGYESLEEYIEHQKQQNKAILEIHRRYDKKDNMKPSPYDEWLEEMSLMENDDALKDKIAWKVINAVFSNEGEEEYSREDRLKYMSAYHYNREKLKYFYRVNFYRQHGWIGCLSEVNDSILMWSYYADSHKGFCVEYDSMEMYESSYIRHNMYPVNYTTDDWADIETGMDLLSLYITLRKSPQWSHEKEWRLVFPNNTKEAFEESDDPKGWNLKMPKPNALYIGAMTREAEEILEIAHEKGLKVYKEKLNYRKLSVEFEELKT